MASSTRQDTTTKKTTEQLRDNNFRRQNKKFEEKGNRLTEFNADVFLLIKRNRKLIGYTSHSSLNNLIWPP